MLAAASAQQLAGRLRALLYALKRCQSIASFATQCGADLLQQSCNEQSNSSTGTQEGQSWVVQQLATPLQLQPARLLCLSQSHAIIASQQPLAAEHLHQRLLYCNRHSTLTAAGPLASARAWTGRGFFPGGQEQPYAAAHTASSLHQPCCHQHSTHARPNTGEPDTSNSTSNWGRDSSSPPQQLQTGDVSIFQRTRRFGRHHGHHHQQEAGLEALKRPMQARNGRSEDRPVSTTWQAVAEDGSGHSFHSHTQQQQRQQQPPACTLGDEQGQHQPQGFRSLGVPDELVTVLEREMRITVPTPVQQQAMQPVAGGRHVAIQSATGTGKTLAWLLPLMTMVKPWDLNFRKTRHGRVLVLAPTQELCMQIVRTARSLIPTDRQAVMPLVGGSNHTKALRSLNQTKPWLIVATPGRLNQVLKATGLLKKAMPYLYAPKAHEGKRVMTLVLEEAPKLLAMDDTKEVLAELAPETQHTGGMSDIARVLRNYQLILVSASLKPSTLASAPAWTQANPVMITAPPPPPGLSQWDAQTLTDTVDPTDTTLNPSTNTSSLEAIGSRAQMLPHTLTHQVITYYPRVTKLEKVLKQCLQFYQQQGQKVLVFVGEQNRLLELSERLNQGSLGSKVRCAHGRMAPQTKMNLIRQFNQGEIDALLASDSFALGLDFENVDVVMQVGSLPASQSQYSHRAGRCGRMGRNGTVVTLVANDKVEQLQGMLKRMKVEPQMVTLRTRESSGSRIDTILPHGAA